jgi:hypothetical protein
MHWPCAEQSVMSPAVAISGQGAVIHATGRSRPRLTRPPVRGNVRQEDSHPLKPRLLLLLTSPLLAAACARMSQSSGGRAISDSGASDTTTTDSASSSGAESGSSSGVDSGLGTCPDSGSSSGQCISSPGAFPAASCVPYPPDAQTCNSPPLACPTGPCTAASPCLAMGADNTGQTTASLRIRKLDVTAPPALATAFVQRAVFDQGVDLANLCGEGGDGTFSWLLQLDTATHALTTGGAAPTTDPFGTGYCFVNTNVEGFTVSPVTVSTTQNACGSFTSDVIPKFYMPMFVAGSPTAVILLPLTSARMEDVTLSESNNCIGNYNPDAINQVSGSTCYDDPSICVRWSTAGSLGAYITLVEADQVVVPQLSESLCVLLTGGSAVDTSNPNEKVCQKDAGGNIVAKGDFCSTTDAPGGCQDSVWFAATFAASAAKIVAPNQPACRGVPIGDGG